MLLKNQNCPFLLQPPTESCPQAGTVPPALPTVYQAEVTHPCQAEGSLPGDGASRNLRLHFAPFGLSSGLRMYRNHCSSLGCEPVEWMPEPGHSLLKFRLLWPPAARSRQGVSLSTRRADLGVTEPQYRGPEVSSLAGGQHPSCFATEMLLDPGGCSSGATCGHTGALVHHPCQRASAI